MIRAKTNITIFFIFLLSLYTNTMSIINTNENSDEIKMMRKLHGNLVLEESGFFKKVTQKDSQLNKGAADAYYNNWKDVNNLGDNDKDVEQRRVEAQNMTNSFYDLVTDFYEYGWGQSFHFAKLYKGIYFPRRYRIQIKI